MNHLGKWNQVSINTIKNIHFTYEMFLLLPFLQDHSLESFRRWIASTQNSYPDVLTPDFRMWPYRLLQMSLVRWSHTRAGWTPNRMTSVLPGRRNSDTHSCTENNIWRGRQRLGWSNKPRKCQRLPANHQKHEEGHGTETPSLLSGGTDSADTLIIRLLPSKTIRQYISVV